MPKTFSLLPQCKRLCLCCALTNSWYLHSKLKWLIWRVNMASDLLLRNRWVPPSRPQLEALEVMHWNFCFPLVLDGDGENDTNSNHPALKGHSQSSVCLTNKLFTLSAHKAFWKPAKRVGICCKRMKLLRSRVCQKLLKNLCLNCCRDFFLSSIKIVNHKKLS